MTGPLEGIRVLDLTHALAGPYGTMLLADMGADVLKIEPPRGDLTRYAEPFLDGDETREFGGYFQSVNRNKRSIMLDMKKAEGRAIFLELVPSAQVVAENFRAGVMDRLGLGYEVLREINPRLVYASVRGFGDPRGGASPYADWPAFDVSAQAFGGFMGITGPAPDQPQQAGPGVGDIFPGTLCALGITAALRHAEQTGQGQYVDVAMYDGVLALCERIVYQHSYTGEIPRPRGNSQPNLCPFGVFPAADGHVTIAAPTNHHWRRLCEIIGHPEYGLDERYKNNYVRNEHRAEVEGFLAEWTATHTKAELVELLGGEVPVGPVNDVHDIVNDPHVKARDMLAEVPHPGTDRTVTIAGTPIKFTETPGGVRRRAPIFGEHTNDVLGELGYSADDIARLRADEVIR